MGDSHMGLQARLMGQAMRKLCATTANNNVLMRTERRAGRRLHNNATAGQALAQVIVLENDLHLRTARVRLVADNFDVAFDIGPIAAQRLAEVDDHVDLDGSVFAGQFGFVPFGFGGAVAVREANNAANQDAGAFEQFRGAFDGVGFDANRRHAAFRGQLAAVLQFPIRHRRMQERVINHPGEFFVGVFHVVGDLRFNVFYFILYLLVLANA